MHYINELNVSVATPMSCVCVKCCDNGLWTFKVVCRLKCLIF